MEAGTLNNDDEAEEEAEEEGEGRAADKYVKRCTRLATGERLESEFDDEGNAEGERTKAGVTMRTKSVASKCKVLRKAKGWLEFELTSGLGAEEMISYAF